MSDRLQEIRERIATSCKCDECCNIRFLLSEVDRLEKENEDTTETMFKALARASVAEAVLAKLESKNQLLQAVAYTAYTVKHCDTDKILKWDKKLDQALAALREFEKGENV